MEVFIGNVLSSLTGFDFASKQKFDFCDSAIFCFEKVGTTTGSILSRTCFNDKNKSCKNKMKSAITIYYLFPTKL